MYRCFRAGIIDRRTGRFDIAEWGVFPGEGKENTPLSGERLCCEGCGEAGRGEFTGARRVLRGMMN